MCDATSSSKLGISLFCTLLLPCLQVYVVIRPILFSLKVIGVETSDFFFSFDELSSTIVINQCTFVWLSS